MGTPITCRAVKMCSEMRLLMTPLPLIVPRFCALNAVASSLKYWMSVPAPDLVEDLGLALINLAAASHGSRHSNGNGKKERRL